MESRKVIPMDTEQPLCPACDGEGGDQRTGAACRPCRGTGIVADASGDDPDYRAEQALDAAEERAFHAEIGDGPR